MVLCIQNSHNMIKDANGETKYETLWKKLYAEGSYNLY